MIKFQFNVWTLISIAIVLWAGSVAYSQQDATKLFTSRYAADGTVVQLLVEEHSASLPKFGIRGIVAKKKKEEAQKLIEELQRLAKSYGELPPGKL